MAKTEDRGRQRGARLEQLLWNKLNDYLFVKDLLHRAPIEIKQV